MNYNLIYKFLTDDLNYSFFSNQKIADEYCEQLNLVAAAAGIVTVYCVKSKKDDKFWVVPVQS